MEKPEDTNTAPTTRAKRGSIDLDDFEGRRGKRVSFDAGKPGMSDYGVFKTPDSSAMYKDDSSGSRARRFSCEIARNATNKVEPELLALSGINGHEGGSSGSGLVCRRSKSHHQLQQAIFELLPRTEAVVEPEERLIVSAATGYDLGSKEPVAQQIVFSLSSLYGKYGDVKQTAAGGSASRLSPVKSINRSHSSTTISAEEEEELDGYLRNLKLRSNRRGGSGSNLQCSALGPSSAIPVPSTASAAAAAALPAALPDAGEVKSKSPPGASAAAGFHQQDEVNRAASGAMKLSDGEAGATRIATLGEMISPRDRLVAFREQAALSTRIPDNWHGESKLRTWVDWSSVDSALQPKGLMAAREDMIRGSRRAQPVESASN